MTPGIEVDTGTGMAIWTEKKLLGYQTAYITSYLVRQECKKSGQLKFDNRKNVRCNSLQLICKPPETRNTNFLSARVAKIIISHLNYNTYDWHLFLTISR